MEPIKSFKDSEWQAFVKKCEERVAKDRKEFGVTSIFLPQPEICPTPKYLIVSMEPSLTLSEEEMEEQIKNGLKGFVHFVIDYCAYKYLCGSKFEYQCVDFCKGVMPVEDAKNTQKQRYANWQALLKEEWELLGKPHIISAGKPPYDNINWSVKKDYIQHYSGANAHRIKEYNYLKLDSRLPTLETQNEMRQVIWKMLDKFAPAEEKLRKSHWLPHVEKDVNNTKLLALYRHNFEQLVNTGKISHF